MKFSDLTNEQINQYKSELTEAATLLAEYGWRPLDMEWDNYISTPEFVEEVFNGRWAVTFSNADDVETGPFVAVRFNPIIPDEAFKHTRPTGPGNIMWPDNTCPQEFFVVQQIIQEKFGGIKTSPTTPQQSVMDSPEFNNPINALINKFKKWLQ